MKSCIGNTYKCGKAPDGDHSINPRRTRKTKGHKDLASQMLLQTSLRKDADNIEDSFALVDFGDAMESRDTKTPGASEATLRDNDSVLPREPSHIQQALAETQDSNAMTAAQARKGTFQPMVLSPPG